MSSFYDDASLVVIPSGYKTSKVYAEKPTDGSGDLTFTRTGDTATRVNSAGLIEKVRTNLFTYSNTFTNANWSKVGGVTITGGQTDPDGGTNATLYARTLAFDYISQSIASDSYTVSLYAKANASNFLRVASAAVGDAVFNLSTGVITSSSSSTALIESVGNGWYRCSVYFPTASTQHFIQNFPVSNGADGAGSIYIYKAQAETGDIATAYIPTTSAAVSVGPVSNVPRLDYLGSTCPRLLLEPQRTNLNLYSEDLTNAFYGKSNCTITANSVTSPDGYQNADTATFTSGGLFSYFYSFAGNSSVTFSFFVKKGNYTSLNVLEQFYFATSITFNLDAKTATGGGKVEDYGNGWLRCSWVQAYGAAQTIISWRFAEAAGGAGFAYFYGFQAEAGAHATSYIPTLAASATRGADACSKTGISSLFGSAFTLFVDVLKLEDIGPTRYLVAKGSGGIYENFISFEKTGNGVLFVLTDSSSVTQVAISGGTYAVGSRLKIAARCQNGSYALYINGVQIGISSQAYTPSATAFDLHYFDYYGNNATNQAMILQPLTNAQLAELTTL